MHSKNNPEAEPEKDEGLSRENNPDSPESDSGNLKSSSAFGLPDDNDLDQVRRTMIQSEEGNQHTENSEEAGQDIINADKNEQVGENQGLDAAEFNQRLKSLNPEISGESELNGELNNESRSPEDQTGDRGSHPNTPAFFSNDLPAENDDENLSQIDKIRLGLIPADTLRQMISDSTSDEEIIDLCHQLGVDWNATIGETREEKIESLIKYFMRDDEIIHQRPFIETPTTPTPTWAATTQDWHESDSRLQGLQDTLNLPETPVKTTKGSFISRFVEDFDQSSGIVKGLTIALSIFAILLVLSITYLYFNFQRISPAVSAPVKNDHPYPTQVRLPGGWVFDLQVGIVKDGNWNPTEPEWLQGTEVCRLVSLPWNKQLDAVYQTLNSGDNMLLTMSNNDLLGYRVESLKTISLTELNGLVTGPSPCLVVVLTRKDSGDRQVILASPMYSSPGGVIVTITPIPTLNLLP